MRGWKSLILFPFLVACGEEVVSVDETTALSVRGPSLMGARLRPAPLAFDRWVRCADGTPRLTRLTLTPEPDGFNVGLVLAGRTCGGEVRDVGYQALDEAGEVMYIRGPRLDVTSLTTDEAGRFELRGIATSSCGNVQSAHALLVEVGEAALSAELF